MTVKVRHLVLAVLAFLLLVSAAVLAGTYLPDVLAPEPTPAPTCKEQAAGYLIQLDALTVKMYDACELALATPRIALNGPISDLQEIKREIMALDAPSCCTTLQAAAIRMAQAQVDAFMAFYAMAPQAEQDAAFQKAIDTLDDYDMARQRIEYDGARYEEGTAA